MRRPLGMTSSNAWIASTVLVLAIGVAGCGGSSSGSAEFASSATSAKKAVVIPFTSTAISSGKIPSRYTCDGANIAPPLEWGKTPPGTRELVLFALGVTSGESSHAPRSVEWAMAGLKPGLHGISAGELPTGAYLVQASDGKKRYSICPPKGQTKRYEFAVYAMPPAFGVGDAIDGVDLLRNLTEGQAPFRAPGQGRFFATYTRR